MALISVIVFITMLGYSWRLIINEGSSMYKNLAQQDMVSSADNSAVQTTMTNVRDSNQPAPAETGSRDTEQASEFLVRADRITAIFCLSLTALLPFFTRWRPSSGWLYLIPALWLFLHSLADTINGGKAHSELSIPAHATRFILPVVLAILIWRPSANRSTANWLLRIATASTFATHGIEALLLKASFQDLINGFAALLDFQVPAEASYMLLRCIGVMDIMLALGVLLLHKPGMLRWMVFWGFITAFARPLTMGWEAWHEFAIRVANFTCPWLIIAIGMSALIKQMRQAEKSPTLES